MQNNPGTFFSFDDELLFNFNDQNTDPLQFSLDAVVSNGLNSEDFAGSEFLRNTAEFEHESLPVNADECSNSIMQITELKQKLEASETRNAEFQKDIEQMRHYIASIETYMRDLTRWAFRFKATVDFNLGKMHQNIAAATS